MTEEQINYWVTSILTLWNTFEFKNLAREYNPSYRDHVKITDKVYQYNQLAYYDFENLTKEIVYEKH